MEKCNLCYPTSYKVILVFKKITSDLNLKYQEYIIASNPLGESSSFVPVRSLSLRCENKNFQKSIRKCKKPANQ